MSFILPDDVIRVISDFSRPYRTRPDWRSCKCREAWNIQHYYEMHHYLFYRLAWFAVTDESGYRLFYDEWDVLRFMRETKMVSRLIRFGEHIPLELNILDMLYVWFERNWALGIVALPA